MRRGIYKTEENNKNIFYAFVESTYVLKLFMNDLTLVLAASILEDGDTSQCLKKHGFPESLV